MRLPLNFHCDECDALARAMVDAQRADLADMRARLAQTARASGRDPKAMRFEWVASIAQMPDDEMRTLMRAHYPRLAKARANKLAHEAATGHSVDIVASAMFMGFRGAPPTDPK